jgi:ABC-type antimicrobial peptide transport system permease subunit
MRTEYVSRNHFTTLGVGEFTGGLFNQNDDAFGVAPVLVLSYLIGRAFGIPAALFTGRLMTSLLFHESSYDPWAFSGAILLLAICAAVAGFIPARRAASIDPMRALRTE